MKEYNGRKRRTLYQLFFKRFLDFVISLLAIIVLSPIFILVYIINLITLKGNPIFAQYRPGKNGNIFKLYKFRSMTNKVDDKGNPLPDNERITKFGKFIRKTSLDELPQLFNILKGDMSLVGPRPRLIRDVIFYDEYALSAYNVRPGLTGWSQITGGRATASFEDIIEKDVYYANHISFWWDLKIFFKTFKVLFSGSSAGETKGRTDYYYSNYLLHSGKITEQQYEKGINLAQEIIDNSGKVEFQADLHNENDTGLNK